MSRRLPVRSGRLFARGIAVDDRDHRLIAPEPVRSRRYWRSSWFGDQGETPQCVGFAAAHWCEAAPVRQFLQPSGIYRLAKYLDEWPGQAYEGTSVRAAAKVLHALGLISRYGWLHDATSVAAWVLERGPVILGIDWTEEMMEPTDGWIEPGGSLVGGHAILADGADTKKGFVRLKNSWGTAWGEGGWARLYLDDLDRLLQSDGEACAAVEEIPTPKATPK